MADIPFTGGVELQRGDGATPTEAFTHVPRILVMPELGATKGLIEVTDFDSVGNNEYISEILGDGKEVSLEWNLVLGEAQLDGITDDVNNSVNRNYKMIIDNGTKTLTTTFTLVPKGWNRTAQLKAQHKASAQFKISGAVVDVVTTNP